MPLAHFSEANGLYKIVCFIAESLPGRHDLCSYCHSNLKPVTPVTELFEQVIKTGTTQHFALVDGDIRTELATLATINNFEFYQY